MGPMKFAWVFSLLFSCHLLSANEPLSLQAHSDSRVELVATVFFLAEVRGFTQCLQPEYLAKVRAHFSPFKDHPAVVEARRLAKKRMIHLGSPISFALHLDASFRLTPNAEPAPNIYLKRIPENTSTTQGGTLDFRWTREIGEAFSEQLQDFAVQTKFQSFLDAQRLFFSAAEQRLTQVASEVDQAWLRHGGFGTFHLIVSPLLGPNNFGPTLPGGAHAAVIGISNFDENGLPKFNEKVREIVIHEFSHPYINPRVDQWMALLQPAGQALATAKAEDFAKTGYAAEEFNPDLLYETLVRAQEVLYTESHGGAKKAEENLQKEIKRGWTWLPAVIPWMKTTRENGSFARGDKATFQELAALFRRCAL